MTQVLAQFSRGGKAPTRCRTAHMQSGTTWMRLPLDASKRKGSMSAAQDKPSRNMSHTSSAAVGKLSVLER